MSMARAGGMSITKDILLQAPLKRGSAKIWLIIASWLHYAEPLMDVIHLGRGVGLTRHHKEHVCSL